MKCDCTVAMNICHDERTYSVVSALEGLSNSNETDSPGWKPNKTNLFLKKILEIACVFVLCITVVI